MTISKNDSFKVVNAGYERKIYTETEIQFITDNYKNMTFKTIACLLNINYNSLRYKAKILGITRHDGSPRLKKNGYIILKATSCPYSFSDGRVYEHMLIWWLCYPNDIILPGEVIHHVDGDKTNNLIENLVKMTRSAHRSLHESKEGEDMNRWF